MESIQVCNVMYCIVTNIAALFLYQIVDYVPKCELNQNTSLPNSTQALWKPRENPVSQSCYFNSEKAFLEKRWNIFENQQSLVTTKKHLWDNHDLDDYKSPDMFWP